MQLPFSVPVALLCSACFLTGSEPIIIDRTLAVSGPVLLEVNSGVGGIHIRPGHEDSLVHVHIIVRPLYGRFDLGLAAATIRKLEQVPPIQQTNQRIQIGYTQPELWKAVSPQLDIEVPRETTIYAQTSSGEIQIEGIAGPLTTETSSGHTTISHAAGKLQVTGRSGKVLLHHLDGSVTARTDSGGIQVLSARGPLELQTKSGRLEVSDASREIRSFTRSGSISIDNAQGSVTATNVSGSIDLFQLSGSVQAQTRSGAIRISQIQPASIRALSHSGAITVDLARRQEYVIDAQSDSGKVVGPHRQILGLAETHQWQEQLGTGAALVDLDTHSSRIEINGATQP